MTLLSSHRIRSVAPDIDVLELKPQQARSSVNLRFTASGNDSNMSPQMVRGNIIVENNAIQPNSGVVVGVCEVGEIDAIYYAFHRFDGNHSVWEYTKTGGHRLLVQASFFNFSQDKFPELDNYDADYNVDMVYILGNLLLTDNKNPKWHIVVNELNKYPAVPQEWHYTQIKHKPLYPLEVTYIVNLLAISTDFTINGITEPYQLSYYYVYIGGSFSRLAPATETIWTNIVLGIAIPNLEQPYLSIGATTIEKVVFCYRVGNQGVWRVIQEFKDITSAFLGTYDLRDASQVPVPANITNADFDLVPLVSKTHEAVQGTITDANYIVNYDNWDGLKVSDVTFTNLPFFADFEQPKFFIRTFLGGGKRYKFGIELLDENGRKIGVIGSKIVTTPIKNLRVVSSVDILEGVIRTNCQLLENEYNDLLQDERYAADVTVEGTLPPWAASYRIVYTRCLDINNFYKTRANVLYWYEDENGNDLLQNRINNQTVNPLIGVKPPKINPLLVLKGIAIRLGQGEPINFVNTENAHVRIVLWQQLRNVDFFNAQQELQSQTGDNIEKLNRFVSILSQDRKVEKQVGVYLYVPFTNTEMENFLFGTQVNTILAESDSSFGAEIFVELFSKRKIDDGVFYQYQSNFEAATFNPNNISLKRVYGDLYFSSFEKSLGKWSYTHAPDEGQANGGIVNVVAARVRATGIFLSQNASNIFAQSWDSDIGEANIVIPNQESVRAQSNMIYSNQIVAGTKLNNINQYTADNVKFLPAEIGSVTKLKRTGGAAIEPGVLLAIGTFQWCSLYPGSAQITTDTGDSLFTTTDKLYPTVRLLKNTFGVKSQKSVCVSPTGRVFAYSNVVMDFVRYTEAGLDAVGKSNAFSNDIRRRFGKGEGIHGYYDQIYGEALMIDKEGFAYVYNDDYKVYEGNRQVGIAQQAPDRVISLADATYFFMNGKMYVSDIDSPFLEFYGIQKTCTLAITCNTSPTTIKAFQSIDIDLDEGEPTTTVLQTDFGHTSTVNKWIRRKDKIEAAILRDGSSVGGLMSGGMFEGNVLIATFVWEYSGGNGRIKFINVHGNPSIVQ